MKHVIDYKLIVVESLVFVGLNVQFNVRHRFGHVKPSYVFNIVVTVWVNIATAIIHISSIYMKLTTYVNGLT